jgi:hypothetical protein
VHGHGAAREPAAGRARDDRDVRLVREAQHGRDLGGRRREDRDVGPPVEVLGLVAAEGLELLAVGDDVLGAERVAERLDELGGSPLEGHSFDSGPT